MSVTVADQQIIRGVTATLSWQNVDGDGEAAAPSGAVTLGISRDDGTTLVATGTATSGTGTDPRTYTLTAANNTLLDLLTVTWTDAGDSSTHTTYVEVVGGYYFTIAEARASDKVLLDSDKYPTTLIVEKRREVEEEFESICGVAFVPRYRRQVISGPGRSTLRLDRPEVRAVRSVRDYADATSYTSWTADELADLVFDADGLVTSRTGSTFWSGPRNLQVAYEHGYSRPPAGIKRAAMERLRYLMNKPTSGIPDRATSFSVSEGGTYRLDMPGPLKTGMPDVDAELARESRTVLVG